MSKPATRPRRSTEPDLAQPTLEDVARHACVSTATVSRCLNTPAQVSAETRKRVLETVRLLGYAPNFGARALAAKRTNTFGAIVPTMENAIFARGLQAFQEALGHHGITTLVASSSYSPTLEEAQIRTLVARGADALLLIGHDRTPESYAFLEKQRVPYVVAWAYSGAEKRLSIGFDNRRAMQALTQKVLALGHRRLGLITAERAGNDRARARVDGVIDAMQAHGLQPDALRLVETTYAIANGAIAFATLMQAKPRPTVVLCGNDVLAAGALAEARKRGIAVPDAVSVTGFDDIEIAEIVTPSLTTVRVPHRRMGQGAAQMLVALRNGKDAGGSVALDPTITMRESLGPPPA
ncbi:MAG: LacI family DNA-binding transcriptional regulator [Pseudomonadota bacterium]